MQCRRTGRLGLLGAAPSPSPAAPDSWARFGEKVELLEPIQRSRRWLRELGNLCSEPGRERESSRESSQCLERLRESCRRTRDAGTGHRECSPLPEGRAGWDLGKEFFLGRPWDGFPEKLRLPMDPRQCPGPGFGRCPCSLPSSGVKRDPLDSAHGWSPPRQDPPALRGSSNPLFTSTAAACTGVNCRSWQGTN